MMTDAKKKFFPSAEKNSGYRGLKQLIFILYLLPLPNTPTIEESTILRILSFSMSNIHIKHAYICLLPLDQKKKKTNSVLSGVFFC